MLKDLGKHLEKLDESVQLMREIRDLLVEVCNLLREGTIVNVRVDSTPDHDTIAEEVRTQMFRKIR